VDRDKDTEAYRHELLNRKLKNEKFLALVKQRTLKEGEKADSVLVLPEEYPNYLSAVYKRKSSQTAQFSGIGQGPATRRNAETDHCKYRDRRDRVQDTGAGAGYDGYELSGHQGGRAARTDFQKNDDLFKKPEKDSITRSRVELNAIVQ